MKLRRRTNVQNVLYLTVVCACAVACGSTQDEAFVNGDGGSGERPDAGSPNGSDQNHDADPGSPTDPNDASTGPDDSHAPTCTSTDDSVTCPHQEMEVTDLTGKRRVAYQTPPGAPPPDGWPVVFFFQGSFVPGTVVFSAKASDPFGGIHLARTIRALLDDGYAVVAPNALSDGNTYWQTNIPPTNVQWKGSSDDVLMNNLFAAVAGGKFGALDPSRLYAMGISSGGFMTSRMAVSYPGKFRALADVAGSYATCSATCYVPRPLPKDHPPTLFLHGDTDTVVPSASVTPYVDALQAEGHETKLVTDKVGHQWLPAGPAVIPAWFDAHP